MSLFGAKLFFHDPFACLINSSGYQLQNQIWTDEDNKEGKKRLAAMERKLVELKKKEKKKKRTVTGRKHRINRLKRRTRTNLMFQYAKRKIGL